jgi:hypothetical protein
VPVIENMEDNGGLDTGEWTNVRTVLGGTSQRRFTSSVPVAVLDSKGEPFNVAQLRTVLINSVQDAFAEVARVVPDYRLNGAGAAGDRLPLRDRTRNHPNGVAIDTNDNTPDIHPRQNWVNHPRRLERGINSIPGFHLLNSLDVERVMERHGWRFGYSGDSPGLSTNGFMHWSLSRT